LRLRAFVVADEDLQLCSNRVAAAVACGQLPTDSSAESPKPIETRNAVGSTFNSTFGVHRFPTRRLGGFHAQTSQWRNSLLECLLQSHERSVSTSGNGDEKPSVPVAFWSETAGLSCRRSRFK
jgi:hypothetical protein